MATTSPDPPPPGPTGRGGGEGEGGGVAAAAAAGTPRRAARPSSSPPPLGLDTAPLLAAVGLLDDGDEEGDEEDGLDTGDVVLREGSEVATYIYIDLAAVDPALLPDGGEVTVEGLDTPTPTLRLPGGATLAGTWRESVGSLLFVAAAGGGREGGGGAEAGMPTALGIETTGDGGAPLPHQPPPHRPGAYLCHTEKVLAFASGGGGGGGQRRKRRAGGG